VHFARVPRVSGQLIGWTCNGMLRADLRYRSEPPRL